MNKKLSDKLSTPLCLIFIGVVTLVLLIYFALNPHFGGTDLPYHLSVIKSLDRAWNSGHFFNRILDLTGQDFGYGTGLFYSTIPAGFAVFLINVFRLPLNISLFAEFFLLISSSSLILYFFTLKVFKNKLSSLISSVVYVVFPYFIFNIFYRFAFTEIFIMFSIPLITWGLYELLSGNNRLFILFFTSGLSFSILVHFTVSIYIVLFVLLFFILNIKKIISEHLYIPITISCFLVLLITCCFYLPMLINYGVVNISSMGRTGLDIWKETLTHFKPGINFASTFLLLTSLIVFYFIYLKKGKTEKSATANSLLIISTISFLITTPLFPWYIMPDILCLVQFPHRLFMISSILCVLQIAYIVKTLTKNSTTRLRYIVPLLLITGFTLIPVSSTILKSINHDDYNVNSAVSSSSSLSENNGLGWNKNLDYGPKGITNEYLFGRNNINFVLNNQIEIIELTNFQSLDQISFLLNKSSSESFITLKIPKDYITNEKFYILESSSNTKPQEINLSLQEINNISYIQLIIPPHLSEIRVVISYQENSPLDLYLKSNPFEFIVKEGVAEFTNFIKKSSSNYTVDISTNSSSRIELPTLFYKGYKLTYTTDNDTYELTAHHGENGFVEISVAESGTLSVIYEGGYVKVANAISIIGLILFALTMLALIIIPRKVFSDLANKISLFLKTHKTISEVLRFLIVGGIATIVDMFTMGVVMYFMQKNIYPGFINVFINSPTPSTLATIIGTTAGFIVGLIVNYILSIFFVFNEKGKSKSAKGFMIFTVLSVIGLAINIVGTYIGFDLLNINQWIVKIVMILIVLVYNYISKKLILFKNKPEPNQKTQLKEGE